MEIVAAVFIILSAGALAYYWAEYLGKEKAARLKAIEQIQRERWIRTRSLIRKALAKSMLCNGMVNETELTRPGENNAYIYTHQNRTGLIDTGKRFIKIIRTL